MTVTTTQILKGLYFLAWLIFIGVCIDAGGFIFSMVYTLFINSMNAKTSWPGIDLSALFNYDRGCFVAQMCFMTIVSVMKAIQFYLIIKIIQDKKLNLARPFTSDTSRLIMNLAYLDVGAGIFSVWGTRYAGWLGNKGIPMPDTESLRMAGGEVWFYMGITLFVIAQVFKKGIEMQTENELTV